MIPLQVHTDDGYLSDNSYIVLHTWKSDYQLLYNTGSTIDTDFMIHMSNVLYNHYTICTNTTAHTENVFLNDPIALYEVENAIQKLKLDKDAGVDMIYNAILKQPQLLQLIFILLKSCLDRGVTPREWELSIIKKFQMMKRNVCILL